MKPFLNITATIYEPESKLLFFLIENNKVVTIIASKGFVMSKEEFREYSEIYDAFDENRKQQAQKLLEAFDRAEKHFKTN